MRPQHGGDRGDQLVFHHTLKVASIKIGWQTIVLGIGLHLSITSEPQSGQGKVMPHADTARARMS